MKNKKTAYIMVPLVLAIWGMIGWKVFAAMEGKGKNSVAVPAKENIKAQRIEISDTIQLLANYRDPFLDKPAAPVKNQNPNSKKEIVKIPEQPKITSTWPTVTYHGLIRRNNDQRSVGFLNVNGASYFVQGGEGAGAVNVGKLWKDSVEVLFGKDKKIFKK
jgi:hypothetical protein